MEIIDALILGLIQGLTEFLPVSSSGHLEILSALLGVQSEENLTFATVVHGGTVLSTIVVFRNEIAWLIKGFFRFEMNPETKFLLKIGVSLIPILIIGFTLKDQIDSLFGGSLMIVGVMLLVTGSLLIFSDRAKPRHKELGYKEAFVVGLAQAFAVIPGLSRSGSTISTGLLLGVKREDVAKFSFLMVLIPIIGINILEIISGDLSASDTTISTGALVTGFLSSFVSGTIACSWMINLVKKGKLMWFAFYCFALGIATLIFLT